MTMEEKLQHFYEVSVENAKEEAKQAVKEYEQVLEASLEEHRQAKKRQMEMELAAETDNARRQMNRTLSTEQMRIRKQLSQKQDQMKEELFAGVSSRLAAFRETSEYSRYLERKAQEARNFAGEDELILTLGAGDAGLAQTLSALTGGKVEVASEDFGGGLRAVIPSKNILMDNTFDSLVQEEKEAFTFDGRVLHG